LSSASPRPTPVLQAYLHSFEWSITMAQVNVLHKKNPHSIKQNAAGKSTGMNLDFF